MTERHSHTEWSRWTLDQPIVDVTDLTPFDQDAEPADVDAIPDEVES